MELRWWTVTLVLYAVFLQNGLADRDEQKTTPCVGELCSEDASPPSQPIPRVGESRTNKQRESIIVIEAEEDEKEDETLSHRLPCTRKEKRQAACLKGECYALDMGQFRSAFCHCPPMYEGSRCEQLSTYFFLFYSAELTKAGIIAGVFFLILLIIVLVSVYFSVKKGRAKKRAREAAERRNLSPESTALKSSREDLDDPV